MRIQKKFAGDGFMMIGISSDAASAEDAVREYVQKNNMAWPQNMDRTRQIHNLFQVHAFPTYIVIDPEGVIRDRIEGWGDETRGRLEDAIKKSMKAAAEK